MASSAAVISNSPSSIPAFLNPTRTELNNIWRILSSREQARRISQDDSFAVRIGTSRQNRRNNRYSDIIAYDSTRILIPQTDGERFHYVNASLISEPDLGFPPELLPRKHWVAAQGPTRETVPSFLSLLVNSPTSPALAKTSSLPLVDLIVQLTPLREGDREKCAPYFPASAPPEGKNFVWNGREDRLDGGDQGLSCSYQGEAFDENGKPWKRPKQRRKWLKVAKLDSAVERGVLHVEYKGWRDHGVPESPTDLLTFIRQMQDCNHRFSDSTAPMLVHCSAGVGRTGTYITISSLLPLLSLLKRNPNLQSTLSTNVPHPLGQDYPANETINGAPIDFVGLTVDRIRDQRTTMVQTREQLEFIFEALRHAWTEMDSNDEN